MSENCLQKKSKFEISQCRGGLQIRLADIPGSTMAYKITATLGEKHTQ